MLKLRPILSVPCALCHSPTPHPMGLCEACWLDLPRLGHCCRVCALPLSENALICGRCQKSPPLFDRTSALFIYAPPLDHLLKRLKFNAQLHLCNPLAQLLAQRVKEQPRPECILPVPLHPTRLRQRGYNQALELARPLSRKLGIPLNTRSLVRERDTPQQTRLDADARRKNLKNAFELRHSLEVNHVALVDDVMTTGSTIHEICKLLRRHNVEQIDVWLIARATD